MGPLGFKVTLAVMIGLLVVTSGAGYLYLHPVAGIPFPHVRETAESPLQATTTFETLYAEKMKLLDELKRGAAPSVSVVVNTHVAPPSEESLFKIPFFSSFFSPTSQPSAPQSPSVPVIPVTPVPAGKTPFIPASAPAGTATPLTDAGRLKLLDVLKQPGPVLSEEEKMKLLDALKAPGGQ